MVQSGPERGMTLGPSAPRKGPPTWLCRRARQTWTTYLWRYRSFPLLLATAAAALAVPASASTGSGQWASATLSVGIRGKRGITAIAIDPRPPYIVYACCTGSGVYRTANGGATWQQGKIGGSVRKIAVDSTGTVYAAGSGVFKSSDHGATWTAIDEGLPKSIDLRAIAIAPSDPRTLYVGGLFGVFRTSDAGKSWRPVAGGLKDAFVFALAVDPRTPNVAYAGTQTRGVFKTSDGGTTWTPLGAGLTAKKSRPSP